MLKPALGEEEEEEEGGGGGEEEVTDIGYPTLLNLIFQTSSNT
jgi:hypothetical protein